MQSNDIITVINNAIIYIVNVRWFMDLIRYLYRNILLYIYDNVETPTNREWMKPRAIRGVASRRERGEISSREDWRRAEDTSTCDRLREIKYSLCSFGVYWKCRRWWDSCWSSCTRRRRALSECVGRLGGQTTDRSSTCLHAFDRRVTRIYKLINVADRKGFSSKRTGNCIHPISVRYIVSLPSFLPSPRYHLIR